MKRGRRSEISAVAETIAENAREGISADALRGQAFHLLDLIDSLAKEEATDEGR